MPRGKKRSSEVVANSSDPRAGKKAVWQLVDLKSDDNCFVRYYGPEGINLLKTVGRDQETEWPKMLETLRTPLPATFRVSPCGNFPKRTMRSLKQHIANIEKNTEFPLKDETTGEILATGPPRPVGEWCPEAWASGTFRAGLKISEPFRRFHQFLVRATDTGAISRQEIVSMIPALLLDVRPGHRVLDMCAAPGSKSLQILEILDQDKSRGVLVANDVDSRRAYMLTKRTKTVKNASLVITTHDATQFPIHRHADGRPMFDRILCDVPCSGDGTMRKNLLLWQQMKARDGGALHPTQLRIAQKAIQCLQVGGILVYSTCSFNPIENEAVVAELLNASDGELELLDTSHMLPGLIRAPGITTGWKVPVQRPEDEKIRYFSTMAEFEEWNSKEEKQLPPMQIRPSMFAPANVKELHLERCLRLLPHDQDTGGFFVAVLRKAKDGYLLRRQEREKAKQQSGAASSAAVQAPAATKSFEEEEAASTPVPPKRHTNRNDVWYEEIPEECWKAISTEWGITTLPKKSFRVRMDNRSTKPSNDDSAQFPNKISWLNEDVLEMFAIAESRPSSLHIVHAGVMAFQRGRGNSYRIANDYASIFLPHVTRRIIEVSFSHIAAVYRSLQEQGHIAANAIAPSDTDAQDWAGDDGEEGAAASKQEKKQTAEEVVAIALGSAKKESKPFEPLIDLKDLAPAQAEYTRSLNEGGVILKLGDAEQARFEEEIGGRFALAAWWGNKTQLRLMVDKQELIELLVQLHEANLIQ